ncbi:MAG: hypothetical protein LBP53_09035 [Candidatus Peribacteria bacterium]|nr:hypothetical protein [Candidatus Peribacteria bacterium]
MFQQACAQRNIEFVEATPKTFNYLTVSVQPNDLVYRSSGTDACRAIEYFLLRNNAISYYTTLLRGMSTLNDSFFINAMVGLPIIPTIPDISNKQTLTEYVAYL